MAQPMMHLSVADKIYTEAPSSIHSYGEFLLGSIAPDAVHMREDYTGVQKRISHYRYSSESRISYFDTFFDEYSISERHVRDYIANCSKECSKYLNVHHMFQC